MRIGTLGLGRGVWRGVVSVLLVAGFAAAASAQALDDAKALIARINAAAPLTPRLLAERFNKVQVVVVKYTSDGVADIKIDAIEAVAKRALERQGLGVGTSEDTVLFIFLQVSQVNYSRGDVRVGTLEGHLAEARLVRRGMVGRNFAFHPVMGILARGVSIGFTEGGHSEADLGNAVAEAIGRAFAEAPFANPALHEEWKPIATQDPAVLLALGESINDATLKHIEADIAGINVVLDGVEGLEADSPFRAAPVWAPAMVNVQGSPYRVRPSVNVASVEVQDISTPFLSLSDLGINSAWATDVWKRTLTTSGTGLEDPTSLRYKLTYLGPLRVAGRQQLMLATDLTVFSRSVIFHDLENDDKRSYVRAPAYLFCRLDTDFTGEGDIRSEVAALIERNAVEFAKRMQSPWLWGPVDSSGGEVAAARVSRAAEARSDRDDALRDGIFAYLNHRELIAVPDALQREYSGVIVDILNQSGAARSIDARWWHDAPNGKMLHLGHLRQSHEDARTRIMHQNPLLFHAHEYLFDFTEPVQKRRFPAKHLSRLATAEPAAAGRLLREYLTDFMLELSGDSQRFSGPDGERASGVVRKNWDGMRNKYTVIVADYVPSDGNPAAVMTRYYWYEQAPGEDVLRMLRDYPGNSRLLSRLSREAVELAPETLAESDALIARAPMVRP